MSIPAVGGGPAHGLQRALMDAAERALADELEMLDGTETGAASGAGTANAARAARRQVTARAGDADPASLLEEAIVVELTEGESEALTVADGWITAARRGPLEVEGEPVPQRFAPGDVKGAEPEGGAEVPTGAPAPAPSSAQIGQTGQSSQMGQAGQAAQAAQAPAAPAQPAASQPSQSGHPAPSPDQPAQGAPGQPAPAGPSIERLIVVLKKTGIDFRDAYQVLREIRGGEPLPSRAELRAQWQAADRGAWQEHAAPAPERAAVPPPRPAEVPVDDLIRDRAWHRAAADDPDRTAGPSLQDVVREVPASQQYVAALTTAEFQRLVTVLGGVAPAWFWELRGHRGLRGLAERPAIARLNATRIAGTRLGAWIVALLGMAVLWYVGIHSQIWW
jgi:hypothetical protein